MLTVLRLTLHQCFLSLFADGTAGGSLFGSYTAPKPGIFGVGQGFGAARQSKDGEDEAAPDAADAEGEGNEVFGGDNVQPVVQLSEVPKHTGEEDEEAIYTGELQVANRQLRVVCCQSQQMASAN